MGIFPEVDLMDCEQVPRADSNTSSVDAIAVAMNQDRTSELLERLRTANFMDDDGNVAEGAFEKCGSSDISSEGKLYMHFLRTTKKRERLMA